jgi:DNA-binding NarL/FixJ family response regulator
VSVPPAVIRVLVCEDQALVRTGFVTILSAQPDMEVVGEAVDGRAAIRSAEELKPDVVVMDIRMFMLKDAAPPELINAVRTVARGESLLAPAVTRALIGRFAERLRPSAASASPERDRLKVLAPREHEVLLLISEGLSNAEIATELVISPETVKTYVSRILTKLNLRDRVQAVVLAYRAGLAGRGD